MKSIPEQFLGLPLQQNLHRKSFKRKKRVVWYVKVKVKNDGRLKLECPLKCGSINKPFRTIKMNLENPTPKINEYKPAQCFL
jgi:hypothetical protein